MEKSDISVVLCTYNGQEFIRRQLTSILDQDLPPKEIIVQDDRSTDMTLSVVEQVANTSPVTLRIYQNDQKLGFADNFISACKYASGKYIAFSDQDDDWYPDKLSTQRSSLVDHRAVLAAHPVDYIDSRGAFLRPPDNAAVRDRARTEALVIEPLRGDPWGNYLGFTMLFSSTLLDKIPADRRGRDPYTMGAALSHDRWIYFLASVYGRTVVVPRVLARYRQHDRQLYGGAKHRSVEERVRDKLANGRNRARHQADIARSRAELLADHGADEAAARWLRNAGELDLRRTIYDEKSTFRRVQEVGRRLRSGIYSSSQNGEFGRVALAEDMVVALGRSLVRPPLRTESGRNSEHLIAGREFPSRGVRTTVPVHDIPCANDAKRSEGNR